MLKDLVNLVIYNLNSEKSNWLIKVKQETTEK